MGFLKKYWNSTYGGLWKNTYGAPHEHSKRNKAKNQKRSDTAGRNLEMLQEALAGGGTYADMIDRISKGYEGKANQLPQFLEQNKGLIITGLLRTDAARELMDTQGFMNRTYAPGVANIEQGVRQATKAGTAALGMSGLSASGVGAAMASQARLGAGAAKGAMYADLMNQHLNAKYGLQRDVAGMQMGFAPQQQQPQQKTDYTGLLMGAGQIAATLATSGGGGGGSGGVPYRNSLGREPTP